MPHSGYALVGLRDRALLRTRPQDPSKSQIPPRLAQPSPLSSGGCCTGSAPRRQTRPPAAHVPAIGLVRSSESSTKCRLLIEQHVQVEHDQHHAGVREQQGLALGDGGRARRASGFTARSTPTCCVMSARSEWDIVLYGEIKIAARCCLTVGTDPGCVRM